jgi:hypothetical protein
MHWWMIACATHGGITWFLLGLIWIVQRVHYPSMLYVEEVRFAEFEGMHCRRIGQIVAPAMIAEGALAVALVLWAPTAAAQGLAVIGAGLAGVIWWSTFFIQVPLHNRLQQGKNTDTIRRLIATNWIRTAAWSLRGGTALGMLLTA